MGEVGEAVSARFTAFVAGGCNGKWWMGIKDHGVEIRILR